MVYWITIWWLRLFFRLLTRLQVSGAARFPQGAYLLVSNHISHFDPLLLSSVSPRAIDWIGSTILFKGKFLNWFFSATHVIPVRQYEADQMALRTAIRRAREGRCPGIFPEGGLRRGEDSILGSGKLYDGGFMIASMGGVPIVPCLVIGSDRLYNPRNLFKRPPIWVRVGKPIAIQGKGRGEIERLRDVTAAAIRDLATELRAEGLVGEEDWPKTPQERNRRIPPPGP